MNKIFNWTLGSVFRTFGRIFAYLIFGLIVGLIMSKNDISITQLLGIDYVHAAQNSSWVTNSHLTMPPNYNISTCSGTPCTNLDYQTISIKDQSGDYYYANANASQFTLNTSGVLISHNTDSLLKNYMYTYQMFFCSNKDLSLDNVNIQTHNSASSGGIRNLERNFSYNSDVYGGGISAIPGDGTTTFNYCFAYRTIFSPSSNSNWLGMRILKKTGSYSGTLIAFVGYKIDSLGLYDEYIEQVIDNAIRSNTNGLATSQQLQDATDSINENVNEVNDSITDDDTDEATSDAGDFFSDFTTDTHGLTAVITAPLTTIQSLLDNNHRCHVLQLPIPFVDGNQTIDMPCMSNIYERHFGNFMYIYHIIIYGIVSYWILVRIFAMVKDFKNPDHDEIEVMEL